MSNLVEVSGKPYGFDGISISVEVTTSDDLARCAEEIVKRTYRADRDKILWTVSGDGVVYAYTVSPDWEEIAKAILG